MSLLAPTRGAGPACSARMLRLDRPDEEAAIFAEARTTARARRAGGHRRLRPAGSLSLGQLRLVEIARALCADPVLLLLDEPAAGLRLVEKRASRAKLLAGACARTGVTVLLVEHDMDFVMNVADRTRRARFRIEDRRRRTRRPCGRIRKSLKPILAGSRDGAAAVYFADLHVAYGRMWRRSMASPSICPQGAIVSVIGANGAGKTTLLNADHGRVACVGPRSGSWTGVVMQDVAARGARRGGSLPRAREVASCFRA